MNRLFLLAALGVALAACDTSAPDLGVAPGTYHLAAIDGRPLPVTVERTREVCSSDAARDYHWVVEARGGTLTVGDDGSARVDLERERVCANDAAVRVQVRVQARGRLEGGRLNVVGASGSGRLGAVRTVGGALAVESTGFGFGEADRELRFIEDEGPADVAGRWTGVAAFEHDTTYAFRSSPDVPRRHQVYRRFDLTFDLEVRGDSVVGTGRFVSVFERVTTNTVTGETQTIGGRDVQQDDQTFPVRGTRDGPTVALSFYGSGVLLDWRGHPLVLDGPALRTGMRNYASEGGYFVAPSADVAFTRG